MSIAYIMSRFPHLPETFILREMNALESLGWKISLYPLIEQKQSVLHKEAQAWVGRAQYLPFLSWEVLKANLQAFFRIPLRYLKTWCRGVLGNLPSMKFLVRALVLFPKSVLMARRMEEEGVQHIHAHYATHPALVAWFIHQLTGLSYSVTVHAHDIFVDRTMLKTKMEAATFIAAISHFNRRYLADAVGKDILAKTQVIHCGIDPSWYGRNGQVFDVSSDRFEILNISSLQRYKGQIYLLEACAALKGWGIPFRLRIIGEGEEHPRLERFIAANGLRDEVLLLGGMPQERVALLLETAHCYVQPSVITPDGKMEGIPVALMEAFASGLPVVATDLSGIPELVRPRETGILVPPEDAGALADAVQRVYRNWEDAKQMAIAGKQLVLEEFDLNKNVEQLALQFQQAINTEKVQIYDRYFALKN